MFKSARIKLTVWYLVIIMAVSISFSTFIYKMVSFEFERRIEAIESRLEIGRLGLRPPVGEIHIFINEIREAKATVFLTLLYTNVAILVFSFAAGYFLAGKTLHPIELALEEQKRFVADASHELKTPLTALQTSIEVTLRDKKLNLKEAKKVLSESLNDIDNLKRLSGDLLSLAKNQNGQSVVKENIEPKDVVQISINKILPIAKKNKIQIRPFLESFHTKIVKDDLEKLSTILIDNAVKYSETGGTVFLTLKKYKNNFELMVKDEGVGISDSDMSHIFERFYRADLSRTKNSVPGFGLGLSIAKKIVNQNKGEIEVKSKLGKGSTFTVRLPIL